MNCINGDWNMLIDYFSGAAGDWTIVELIEERHIKCRMPAIKNHNL